MLSKDPMQKKDQISNPTLDAADLTQTESNLVPANNLPNISLGDFTTWA